MFLPEQLVVSVDEYALQQQKDNAVRSQEDIQLRSNDAIQSEIKAAEAVGMTVADYREQQKSYADLTRQAMENKRNPPDPPIEDEERLAVGSGGLGQKGELTDTIQAIQVVSQGASKERIEEERKALSQMKSWHEQRHHQENDHYQVIEGGKESIVEDGYVQIAPYTSSSEQDNKGRGQTPNLSAIAEGMRVSHHSKPSPRDQHYMKGGDGTSLPSYFNDGSHDHPNHSPHSSHRRPSPTPPRDTHPPADPLPVHPPPPPTTTDPHHQFTIGSMVCVDMQKGQPLYGVIKWMGTVTDFPGTIAGVELVST